MKWFLLALAILAIVALLLIIFLPKEDKGSCACKGQTSCSCAPNAPPSRGPITVTTRVPSAPSVAVPGSGMPLSSTISPTARKMMIA